MRMTAKRAGAATPRAAAGASQARKSALLLSTIVGLAFATGTAAFAAAPAKIHATGVAPHFVKPAHVPGVQGKVKGSVAGSGTYGSSASGFALLDTETVSCKGRTGCTLEMSAMVQQCDYIDGPAAFAILTLVDGNAVDNGPFLGYQDNTICTAGNWQGVYPVSAGNHTVQFYAYEGNDQYIGSWSDRTDVVVP